MLAPRWISSWSQNIKIVESFHPITGFSMVFVDKSGRNLQYYWMSAYVLKKLHYIVCTCIWKTMPNVEVFVDTWTYVSKDFNNRMKSMCIILTVYLNFCFILLIFKELNKSNIISHIWLINHLKHFSNLFTCYLEHSQLTEWKHSSLQNNKIQNSWENILSLFSNQHQDN